MLVLQKLLSLSTYSATGLVRTNKSLKKLSSKAQVKKESIGITDVTDLHALTEAFKGVDKVVMCTSAVPKIKIWSIIKVLVFKVLAVVFKSLGKNLRPEFYFGKNGDPYNVDWLGAKNQIDAAKAAGVKQFVFLSSMGGTQPENFLNTIGKIPGDENSGNILLWKVPVFVIYAILHFNFKRCTEKDTIHYLMEYNRMACTILHCPNHQTMGETGGFITN